MIAAVLLAAAAPVIATSGQTLTATLDAKHQVPPQVVKAPSASGRFAATLTSSALTWRLTYRNLSSRATFAFVFLPASGKQGQIVLDLCRPRCPSGAHGTVRLVPAVARAVADRSRVAYVEILTVKNPKGEIRGRISRS